MPSEDDAIKHMAQFRAKRNVSKMKISPTDGATESKTSDKEPEKEDKRSQMKRRRSSSMTVEKAKQVQDALNDYKEAHTKHTWKEKLQALPDKIKHWAYGEHLRGDEGHGDYIRIPGSPLDAFYDNVIFFLVLYTIAVVPLEWAFHIKKGGAWHGIEILFEVIFLFDICLQFRTAYRNESDDLIVSPKTIALHYLKTFLIWDFLGSVPVDTIATIAEATSATASGSFLAVLEVLKACRVCRFYRLSHHNPTFEVDQSTIIKLVVGLILVVHTFACAWYAINRGYDNFGGEGNWFYDNYDVTSETPMGEAYLVSLYSLLTWINGEDVGPVDSTGRLFGFTTLLVGSVVFATLLGNITVMVANQDVGFQAFQEKMHAVEENMKYLKLPPFLQKQVIDYYTYCWERFRGQNMAKYFAGEESNIPLSGALRSTIALHVHAEAVMGCHLFEDCKPEFIYSIVMALKLHIVGPGDFIVQSGDDAHEMYFLQKGKAAVLDDAHVVVWVLKDGDIFGEIAMCMNRPRSASIQARTYVELQELEEEDFKMTLHLYPEDGKKIIDLAKKRAAQNEARRLVMHEMQLKEQRAHLIELGKANKGKVKPCPHPVPKLNKHQAAAAKHHFKAGFHKVISHKHPSHPAKKANLLTAMKAAKESPPDGETASNPPSAFNSPALNPITNPFAAKDGKKPALPTITLGSSAGVQRAGLDPVMLRQIVDASVKANMNVMQNALKQAIETKIDSALAVMFGTRASKAEQVRK